MRKGKIFRYSLTYTVSIITKKRRQHYRVLSFSYDKPLSAKEHKICDIKGSILLCFMNHEFNDCNEGYICGNIVKCWR